MRVARTLAEVHGFRGYIHLKTIPEASPWLIEQAGRWADRLSINIELPTESGLARFAPEKREPSIRGAMGRMRDASTRRGASAAASPRPGRARR